MVQSDQPDSSSASSLKERVAQALDALRPMLQADGGDVELVDVGSDGVVRVRFQGACVGCPARRMTLTQGIESHVKAQVPEVTEVVLAE